jgi:hypothetical protein
MIKYWYNLNLRLNHHINDCPSVPGLDIHISIFEPYRISRGSLYFSFFGMDSLEKISKLIAHMRCKITTTVFLFREKSYMDGLFVAKYFMRSYITQN